MTEAQIKLLADLRSGAVPGSGDLVSRADVLRVLKRLGDQDADLALYGAADNARAREYGEAAMTRACCAVAIMPTSPDLASLAEMIEGLVRERDEAWADWSALPKDLYVTEVRTGDGIVFDVALCSVPMAIGPEVRYSRAETPRCEHCDNTGDAHSIDGEWRGYCACPAGVALAAEAERDALREALAAEREACAAFVEAEAKHLPGGVCDMKATCRYLANEIRARALTMETNDG